MRTSLRLERAALRDFAAVGLLLASLRLTPALSQEVPLPQIVNAVSGPACAASANMTGHMICVVRTTGGSLTAISEAATDIRFMNGTFTLDSHGFNNLTLGPKNPLPLNINGAVGGSGCASTADSSADVVCAYNSGGELEAVRFSILANTQTITGLDLGMPVIGNASCAIGAMRGDANIHNGAIGPFMPAQEGDPGETICAFRSTNNELWGIAFNPAAPAVIEKQDLGVVAIADPSCVDTGDGVANVNQGTTHVICAFLTANNLQGVAFDPRQAPLHLNPTHQNLYVGTVFTGNPGCTTPNDGSGQIVCAISGPGDTLYGFAFNPRSAAESPLQSLGGTAVTGAPACAGLGDGTNRVTCAVRSSTDIVYTVKFDPRTTPAAFSTGVFTTGITSAADDLSCIFLNIHAAQINCGGVLASQGELFGVILHPLISPGSLSAAIFSLPH